MPFKAAVASFQQMKRKLATLNLLNVGIGEPQGREIVAETVHDYYRLSCSSSCDFEL